MIIGVEIFREISVRIIPKYSPGINQSHSLVNCDFFFYYTLYWMVSGNMLISCL
jgi:hypothetical protein